MRLAFERVDSVKQTDLPIVGGHHPIPPGSEQNKKKRKGGFIFLLACLLCCDMFFSYPWTGIYTSSSLGLRPSNLDLNYTTSFPGSPACRQQKVGPLSLHNHVSKFFIINLSLSLFLYIYIYIYTHTHTHTYVYISYWFCFSGEP